MERRARRYGYLILSRMPRPDALCKIAVLPTGRETRLLPAAAGRAGPINASSMARWMVAFSRWMPRQASPATGLVIVALLISAWESQRDGRQHSMKCIWLLLFTWTLLLTTRKFWHTTRRGTTVSVVPWTV